MFTASLTAAVLSGVLASGSLESAHWRTSYREAATAAADLRKPIAVFITTGSPAKLVKEGTLGKDAARLLREGFIPLTVDTGTATGKDLAGTFNLTEGLVSSDRTGGVQALRHAGGVTDAELKGYLERYAAPTATVVTTEYRGAAPAAVVPQSQAPQYQPALEQSQYQPALSHPQYQPAPYQPAPYQPQPVYQPQYSQPRPVLNAIQNVGGFVQNVGSNAIHNVGGFVQNVGGFLSGST